MKTLAVVGARPQFVKAAIVTAAVEGLGMQKYEQAIVHSGQHYDDEMSDIFFRELKIPPPKVNLGVGSGPQGQMTGRILENLEQVLMEERPDCVIVFGDTNTTLAGALAAVKLQIPVAHVEAGLRSYNRAMPEEHNRVLVDHCSDLLFCPNESSVKRLEQEGIRDGVHNVGDVMFDVLVAAREIADKRSTIHETLGLRSGGYLLATVHRSYNTDDPARLKRVLEALGSLGETVVWPIHPRTRKAISTHGLSLPKGNVKVIEPVGYFDMVALEQGARMILTDSGGVQKEAYMLSVPCLTLRSETEWEETVASGWNRLFDLDSELLPEVVDRFEPPKAPREALFGDGRAAQRIVEHIASDIPAA